MDCGSPNSAELCKRIICQFKNNVSDCKIVNNLGLSPPTGDNIVTRFRESGELSVFKGWKVLPISLLCKEEASTIFYALVCWGGSMKVADTKRLNKLIGKAKSVVGEDPDSLNTVAERRTLCRLKSIIDNADHPCHSVVVNLRIHWTCPKS